MILFWLPRRSRPSPQKEAWTPKLDRGTEREEHVPRRLRGVKLRRARARMSDTPIGAWIVIVAVLGAVVIFALRAIFGLR